MPARPLDGNSICPTTPRGPHPHSEWRSSPYTRTSCGPLERLGPRARMRHRPLQPHPMLAPGTVAAKAPVCVAIPTCGRPSFWAPLLTSPLTQWPAWRPRTRRQADAASKRDNKRHMGYRHCQHREASQLGRHSAARNAQRCCDNTTPCASHGQHPQHPGTHRVAYKTSQRGVWRRKQQLPGAARATSIGTTTWRQQRAA